MALVLLANFVYYSGIAGGQGPFRKPQDKGIVMFGTAFVLFLIAGFFAVLTRVTVWLTWNLEIVTSLRQKTTIKLVGLAFMLLFMVPGIIVAFLAILDTVRSVGG